MPNINWTWLIVGILLGIFVIPFAQAKLTRGGSRQRTA